VNALCPLLSGTGLFEQFVGVPYNDENMKKFLFNVPLGRLTDPGDFAAKTLPHLPGSSHRPSITKRGPS